MNSDLPATGTVALLELLDPFVPDDFINECWPHGPTGGRHCEHTSAQLFRVHLLCLLSPVHSVNLLIKSNRPAEPSSGEGGGYGRMAG